MASKIVDPSEVVSPNIYGLILSSPRLRKSLMPEGMGTSPYRIENYQAIVTLADPRGRVAIFERTQRVQFQQDGVAAILDHFWGDGVTIAQYSTTAGKVGELIRDSGRRHLVIELPRGMARGEFLEFATERTMMETFLEPDGYFELTIDHPIEQLSHWVLFPQERSCQDAVLGFEGSGRTLPVQRLPGGKTLVRLDIKDPRAHTPYRITWRW